MFGSVISVYNILISAPISSCVLLVIHSIVSLVMLNIINIPTYKSFSERFYRGLELIESSGLQYTLAIWSGFLHYITMVLIVV